MFDELSLRKIHKVKNKERDFTMINFHVEAKVRNYLY
jgi:hypothetical protein